MALNPFDRVIEVKDLRDSMREFEEALFSGARCLFDQFFEDCSKDQNIKLYNRSAPPDLPDNHLVASGCGK
jgi:hypothetical protein